MQAYYITAWHDPQRGYEATYRSKRGDQKPYESPLEWVQIPVRSGRARLAMRDKYGWLSTIQAIGIYDLLVEFSAQQRVNRRGWLLDVSGLPLVDEQTIAMFLFSRGRADEHAITIDSFRVLEESEWITLADYLPAADDSMPTIPEGFGGSNRVRSEFEPSSNRVRSEFEPDARLKQNKNQNKNKNNAPRALVPCQKEQNGDKARTGGRGEGNSDGNAGGVVVPGMARCCDLLKNVYGLRQDVRQRLAERIGGDVARVELAACSAVFLSRRGELRSSPAGYVVGFLENPGFTPPAGLELAIEQVAKLQGLELVDARRMVVNDSLLALRGLTEVPNG